VGPRSTLAYQVEGSTPRQRARLAVNPGLTGLAQVTGRNAMPWAQRIELDLEYVDEQSVWLDLELLLRTALAVVRGSGVTGHPEQDPLAQSSPDQL